MANLDIASFTAFDWTLVALVAFSTVLAFHRGVVRVLFSILGLVAGILIASWNYEHMAALLLPYFPQRVLLQIGTFVLLLVVTYCCFEVVGAIIRRTVHAVGLGLVDRFCGAIFGFGRGLLVAGILLAVIAVFLPDSYWIQNSRLSPYFFSGAHAVSFVVPETFGHQIADGASRLLTPAGTAAPERTNAQERKHRRPQVRRDPGGE